MIAILRVLPLFIFATPLLASSPTLDPKQRQEEAELIVDGSVISTSFSEKLRGNDLWKAVIEVENVIKGDRKEGDKIIFYYRKQRPGDNFDFRYANIEKGMTARFFLKRSNPGSKKDVLFIWSEGWIKRKRSAEPTAPANRR
jgi:hypothetical protein